MTSAFDMLDSSSSPSVEALAFNYLRYGLLVLVNHLWTLVALLTAALSFWRFNLLPSLARRHCLLKSSSPSSSSVALAESQRQLPTIFWPVDSDQSTLATAIRLPTEERSNSGTVFKGNRLYSRFCYDDDVIFHHQDKTEKEEAEEIRLVSIRRLIHEEDQTLRFDVMERLRLSDLGFYDYQDMRVLDGNVVKLWDNSSR